MYKIFTINNSLAIGLIPAKLDRHTFETIPSLMYICDPDPIIKAIVVYVGYPLN